MIIEKLVVDSYPRVRRDTIHRNIITKLKTENAESVGQKLLVYSG